MESIAIDPGFLKKAGIASSICSLTPLRGGANNRVYKVLLDQSPPIVLKHYFSHPSDLRLRLKSEYEFIHYAWEMGIRSIPQPFAQDPIHNMALYSFIDGISGTHTHADESYVEAASEFLLQLNRDPSSGEHLGLASEACLEFKDYLSIVEKRLERLSSLPKDPKVYKQLKSFLAKRLIPKWNECKTALHSYTPNHEDRIISPSDFGLHNTIFSNGKPIFIDFEYAGWDDPAKTICDFFLQPKIPVSISAFESFAKRLSSLTKDPSKTLERTRRLFPISKIKWCCIILNVFSKVGKSRRDFAKDPQIFENQLQLAEKYLADGPNL
jgi:thiamine kinase-like enzyme